MVNQFSADLCRAGAEFFVGNHIKDRQGRGHCQRTGRVGAAQAARHRGVHNFSATAHGRQRHTTGQTLGQGHEIRHNTEMLHREHRTGAGKAGLDFVSDQQNTVLVTKLAQRDHEFLGHDIKAAFALDRLDDNGCDLVGLDVGLKQLGDRLERVVD